MGKSENGKGWHKNVSIIYLILIFNSPFNIKLVKVGTKFHIIILICLIFLFVRKIFLIYFLFIFPHTRLSRLSTNLHFVIYRENNLYPWVSTSYIITGIQSRYSLIQSVLSIYHIIYICAHIMSDDECANSVSDKMSANCYMHFWDSELYKMLNENIFRTSSSSQRKNPCHLRPCRL